MGSASFVKNEGFFMPTKRSHLDKKRKEEEAKKKIIKKLKQVEIKPASHYIKPFMQYEDSKAKFNLLFIFPATFICTLGIMAFSFSFILASAVIYYLGLAMLLSAYNKDQSSASFSDTANYTNDQLSHEFDFHEPQVKIDHAFNIMKQPTKNSDDEKTTPTIRPRFIF
jgi:hypothetical protein